MQIAANGIQLEVEDHGSPNGEPLVLIMGLGMQLVAWHEDFVLSLVKRGFRVLRFDNRDIGLSQSFDHLGMPNVGVAAMKHAIGLPVRSPYSLADLADDTVGLLDAFGIARAHVCGASMGGMVAQHIAQRHPKRLASLTLMMTSSGARRLPGPSLKVRGALLSRPADPKSLDSVVAHYVQLYKLIGSPGYPASDEYLHQRLGLSVRRSHRPRGVARQLVAIAADGDRSPWLSQIAAPTQVLHGLADPLVPVAAGRDLAVRIPNARLDLIEGMGHDLPQALWPRFADGIAAAAGRA
ncbi:MAG TPA: alpha/beta fold hydrolase [Albitalea sp.]|uniref:alpha/beta fold hydrolase n=1 Tax=Piscinibacter sp. TaxID=1903157 RepID=UPI002ED648B3